MRKLVSSVLATIGVLVSTSVLAQPIKIGAPQPMTGPDAPFGDKFKKAYAMAIEEINAAGGVNGRKLEIVIEDHQAKNALAATVAEKLITQEKVLVMTGGRASGPGHGDRLGLPAAQDAVPGRPPVGRHDHHQGVRVGLPQQPDRLDLPGRLQGLHRQLPGRHAEVGGGRLRQHALRQDHRRRGRSRSSRRRTSPSWPTRPTR